MSTTFADILTAAARSVERATDTARTARWDDAPEASRRLDAARARLGSLQRLGRLCQRASEACAGERPVLLVVPHDGGHDAATVDAALREELGHPGAVAVAAPEDAAQRDEIVAACAAEFEVVQ